MSSAVEFGSKAPHVVTTRWSRNDRLLQAQRDKNLEIIIAEIVWSATKATGAAAIMLTVLALPGFIHIPQGLMLIPLAFLGGLAFGAIGMFFMGIIPIIDMFNLPIFLFITPMFLFSGTFSPVSNLPQWIRPATAFPLYHLTELARWFSLGIKETGPIASIGYLILFTLFLHIWR